MHSGYHKVSLIQDFSIKPKETKHVQVYIQNLLSSGLQFYYLFFYGMLKGPVHQVQVNDQSNISVEIYNTSNKKVVFSQRDQFGIACFINKFDLEQIKPCQLFQRPNIISDRVDNDHNQFSFMPLINPHEFLASGLADEHPTSTKLMPANHNKISSSFQPYSQQNDEIAQAHLFSFNDGNVPSTSVSNTTTKPVKKKYSEPEDTTTTKKKISYRDFMFRKTYPILYGTIYDSKSKNGAPAVSEENSLNDDSKECNTADKLEQEVPRVRDDIFEDKLRNNEVINDFNKKTVAGNEDLKDSNKEVKYVNEQIANDDTSDDLVDTSKARLNVGTHQLEMEVDFKTTKVVNGVGDSDNLPAFNDDNNSISS